MKQIIDHLSQPAVQEYCRILLSHKPEKSQLLLPKDSYFTADGLDFLARDISKKISSKPQQFRVVHDELSDYYALRVHLEKPTQIVIQNSLSQTPHLQAFIIMRAVVHAHINTLFSEAVFRHDAIEKLINALVIKYGFAIIALNASEEIQELNKTNNINTTLFDMLQNTRSLDISFQRYCRQYRVSPKIYGAYLLLNAKNRLLSEGMDIPSKPFVLEHQQKRTAYQLNKRTKRALFVLFALVAVFISYAAAEMYNRNLNSEKQEITAAKFDLDTCIQELETMLSASQTQDIYTLRSIASKQKKCETLRTQHNELILKFTSSD